MQTFSLLWSALFLESQAYATMRDEKSPVTRGLVILIVLGLALGLAGFIGATLEWASSPSLTAIKDTMFEQFQQAPWWQLMATQPEAAATFEQVWDQVWQIMGFIVPSPASSWSGLIFQPIGLIIGWLIYGIILHIVARILGGTASLGQTLGVTSLAAAPQLLGLITVLPYVAVAGIATWTLLCRYMAVRVGHNLSWGRSLWTLIITSLVLFIIGLIIVISLSAIFASVLANTFGGGQ